MTATQIAPVLTLAKDVSADMTTPCAAAMMACLEEVASLAWLVMLQGEQPLLHRDLPCRFP